MRFKITTLQETKIVHYTLRADSKDEAILMAQKRDGILPLRIEEKPLLMFPIASEDLKIAIWQFYLMSSANLPLQHCINSLKCHTRNKRLACIFRNISLSLENGLSLYESFAPYESIFGNLALSLIEFGSKSGKLAHCLGLLLDDLNQKEKHQKELKKALFYPCFVLLVTTLCFAFLLHWVVPQFVELFVENQIELPFYTRLLISLQEWVSQYGLVCLACFAGIFAFCVLQFKTQGMLYQPLLTCILHFPIVGRILYQAYLQHYCLVFSLLLQSGMDLHTCVSLARQSIPSMWMQTRANRIENSLINGKTLSLGVKESGLFDAWLISLLEIGEQSARVQEIFEICAKSYEQKNASQIEFLLSLIEPVLTLFLGIFILFLALGIFVPIWNLA